MMITSGLEVRRLTTVDAEIFRTLRLEALQKNPEAFTSSYQEEAELPIERFAEQIELGGVFVVFKDSQPVGVAALSPERSVKKSHIGHLWSVYIRPDARKLGAGRVLMAAVIVHAEEHFDLIQLTLNSSNQSAYRLYEGLGFVQYGVEKYAVKADGHYFDEILMMKTLKSAM
jgi:ribosomal protein S18 acetylase RimI-like enzyme